MKKQLLLLFALLYCCMVGRTQITVTVNATGATGSYKTGWVDQTGAATDGDMNVSTTSPTVSDRGWAVFDLSTAGIPAGALVTHVTLTFEKTAVNGTSPFNICQVYGDAADLSTESGTTLYGDCKLGSVLANTTWGITTGMVTVTMNATGNTFIQTNETAIISLGFDVGLGSHSYTITGEGGTTTTQPQLAITYLDLCSGQPTIGTASANINAACPNASITLSLTGGDALASGFSYQWQSSPTGLNTWSDIGTAGTSTTYTFTGQSVSSDYQCVLTCSFSGLISTSNIVTITEITDPTQCYCIPYPGSDGCDGGDDVNDFYLPGASGTQINSVATGCIGITAYDDLTADTVTLMQGITYSGQVSSEYESGGGGDEDDLSVWIDFGDDGIFDATDQVCIYYGVTDVDVPITVAIPAGAAVGPHRMRVMVYYDDGTELADPCNSGSAPWDYGETHDYVANIIAAIPCDTVTNLTASGITSNGVTLTWDAVAGAAGYEYVIDVSATDPTGAGTATTNTTVSSTSFLPGIVYYAHVRVNCGAGYSGWITITFTTPGTTTTCDTVTNLTASGITQTGVTLTWTAVAGAAGYEYAVDVSPTPPASGTPTTNTTATVGSLTAGTVYYAHVHVNCGGTYSAWITITFTTAAGGACTPVPGITTSGITSNSVTLSWSAMAGAVGYEYAVDVNSTPPASGTATTNTTATVGSLLAGTVYYAHVRVNCGSGFSAWTTVTFSTLPATAVNTVTATGFAVSVFPNPAKNSVTLNVSGDIGPGARMMLTDLAGRTIKTADINTPNTDIDLSNIATGTYLIKYADGPNNRVIKLNKL